MTTRYFLYARKSQGRSDRQMLSIPAQTAEMTAFAERNDVLIVNTFVEARTAKEPGRPIFKEVLDRIEKGEADGVLTWKIDRLSRNPIDDGRISWMLQKGTIAKIQTIERSYLPEDNVLFMRMEQGMANQYIRDLSKNVKRGLRRKAKDGWLPNNVLPLGYMRNLDKKDTDRVILKDQRRFSIIRELWRLYGTGVYSISEIKKMSERLGLKNHKGGTIAMNSYHLMFRNPFYAGYFYWNDINGNKMRIKGKHPAMVSEAEFLTVQDIITNRGRKTRSKSYDFAYKGLLTCGECSGQVTAEKKHRTTCTMCKKRFSSLHRNSCPQCGLSISEMKEPIVFDKTYYHCTRTKNPNCSQRAITEKYIDETICEVLSKIEINKQHYKWAIEKLRETDIFEKESPILLESLKKKRTEINTKLNRLLDLRVSGEITKEQNDNMCEEYTIELEQVNKEIVTREGKYLLKKHEAESYINFAVDCVQQFKKASNFKKREMIAAFLSSQKILDKNLYISTKKPLKAIFPVQSGFHQY